MAAKGFSEAEPLKLLSYQDFASQREVSALYQTLQDEHYVHAYLISGMQGIGKFSLAMWIAQYLLCSGKEQERPCGSCPGCVQVRSANHPDLILLGGGAHISADSKDSGKSGITVGDIREAVRIAGTHTYEGGCRVFIIRQAEDMTQQAQNSLLKTLEEPIEGNVFLLTTDSPSLLLPTIISRCRQVRLHAYPDAVVKRCLQDCAMTDAQMEVVLRNCGGSVGMARQMAEDDQFWKRRASVMEDFFKPDDRSQVVRISNKYKDGKEQWQTLLADVDDLIRTLMLVRLGRLKDQALAEYPPAWQRMAHEAPLEGFTALLDDVTRARQLRLNQVTWQAVVEHLLFSLMEEKAKWSM